MQELASRWFAAAVGWLHQYGLFAPLVQLLLATLLGFVFAEQWQRWRQRRDFQYRTLGKFSELSYEMMDRLSELLVGRGRILPDLYTEKRREMVSRWTVFMSMRGEVMACYGRKFLLTEEYQGLFKALNALREYVRAPQPVPLARFEPEQEKFLAYREAIVADMVGAMGLVSRRQRRAEKRAALARVQEGNAAVARAESQDSPPSTSVCGTRKENGEAMAVSRNPETLRAYVTYQGTYHNHKEQLGYFAAALYVSGALLLFFSPNRWSQYSSWGKALFLTLLSVTGAAGLFYVYWQFHLRSIAAVRIERFIDWLGRENWPEPEARGQLYRWAAPGAALLVMFLWGAAALVRVACGLGP